MFTIYKYIIPHTLKMEENLILSPAGFNTWRLEKRFQVITSIGKITVPEGKITDLASTPKWMWGILPPFGRYTKAAVVHDYMYGMPGLYKRKVADKIFYELMIKYGTYKWKAKIMYTAVRVFGGFWRK